MPHERRRQDRARRRWHQAIQATRQRTLVPKSTRRRTRNHDNHPRRLQNRAKAMISEERAYLTGDYVPMKRRDHRHGFPRRVGRAARSLDAACPDAHSEPQAPARARWPMPSYVFRLYRPPAVADLDGRDPLELPRPPGRADAARYVPFGMQEPANHLLRSGHGNTMPCRHAGRAPENAA